MRVLILGGTGMLGHTAWQALSKEFDVYVTIRGSFDDVKKFSIFDQEKTICHACVEDFQVFEDAISSVTPDVILNCIGIVKQLESASDPIKSITVNALFPHKLAAICHEKNIRLIHLSTDCVFSGNQGSYVEADTPDPLDLYGHTKLLGEVSDGNVLTIRTSMIGNELSVKSGLLEWFLSQKGKGVNGYTNAIFSGFTVAELSRILKDVMVNHQSLKGLYHISSDPISKLDLLMLIKNKMQLNIDITPDEFFRCDRSLDSTKFRQECNYIPPTWEEMVDELCERM